MINMISIKVKYFQTRMPELTAIEKGDWIDVRASRVEVNGVIQAWHFADKGADFDGGLVTEYKAGDFIRVFLGFAMELPKGYEAHIAPRGSLFKNCGLIQTNSVGVVDNSFCGDGDEWFVPFYATRNGKIGRFDRVAQFRTMLKMKPIDFIEVEVLGNSNRGGHGTTGVN